uniref:Uncharacterized protein n=1 Tax=Pleonosporium borreri TaxID=2575635 RepID=A0A4D6WWI7_9FLOR|nr:hypothetical protein [Pleonosporium borreri]
MNKHIVKYWPQKPSIELNYAVVDLFIKIRQKCTKNLTNNTNYYLYTDILDNNTKCRLFTIILNELEILLLDILELNLTIIDIQTLDYQILCNFIDKNLITFLYDFNIHNNESLNLKKYAYSNILLDKNLLIAPLLIYLLFGSYYIDDQLFIFNYKNTPKEHIIILFENFIIQSSNLIVYNIFNRIKSLPKIIYFFKKNHLCNINYLSTRSISLFLNQLTYQYLLYTYIYLPKAIYSSRYQVWIISSQGLIKKNIYVLRIQDLYNISKNKYIFLLIIEILDIIIPKIEKILLILGKILFY